MSQSNYPSGAASLFAVAARQPTEEPGPPAEEPKSLNICWWCLEFGTGDHVSVFGTKVLANHSQCRVEAEQAEKAGKLC